jgi:hypothetical protein
MPRIRTIKPEWIEDERFNACSDAAMRLAHVFYALVDDDGRCKASVRALGLAGWKFCDVVIDKTAHAQAAVAELVQSRWLISYVANGEQHWCIRNFAKHQVIAKYKPSRLPPPPDQSGTSPDEYGSRTEPVQEPSSTTPVPVPNPSGMVAVDLDLDQGSGRDWKGKGLDQRVAAPETPVLTQEERESPVQIAHARSSVRGEYIRRGYEARFKSFYAGRKPAVKPPREVGELTCPLWSRLAAELEDQAAADVFLDRAFAHAFLAKRGHRPSLLEEMRVEILAGDVPPASSPGAAPGSPVAMAQAARDAAEKACADARRRRDSLAGLDGHEEASRDFQRKQRALGDADDALEAAKREVAA